MGDIVGTIGPAGFVDEPHPASFPPDHTGRPNPTEFIRDMYEHVGGEYIAIIGPRDLRLSRGGRLPGVGPLVNRIWGSPWARDLHDAEVDRLKAPEGRDLMIAEEFLGYALERLGVNASLGYTTRPNTVENFSPQTLTLNDLVRGGLDIHGLSDFDPVESTTVGEIFEAERNKKVHVSGVMETLLKHYDPETTLEQILADLQRIQIRPIDLAHPQGHGYEFGFTAFNGVPVRGKAAIDEINLLHQPVTDLEIVNRRFVRHAEAVHQAAEAAGGRLVFSGTDGNPRYLVGTGLTGEIASEVVRAFFEGAGNVYMPGETIEESRLAAALVAKNSAVANGIDDGTGKVLIYGGQLLVGETDSLDAGRFVATVQSILPQGAQAIYAAMLSGLAQDDGYEVLAEAAQHGIAVGLAKKRLISGFFRRLGPARAGKLIGADQFKNDIIYAQGLPYNVAQLMKVWSTEVLVRRYRLAGTSPTGPITLRKDPRDNPFIKRVADVAEETGVYLARHPQTTGSLAAIELMATQLIGNRSTQSRDMARATGTLFDGNVYKLEGGLNRRLVTRGLPRAVVSKRPFRKPPGPPRENVRVNGPLVELIRGQPEYKDISEITDQVIARAVYSERGFDPFTFKLSDGSTNFVLWIKDPSEFPYAIQDPMKAHWNNSLGVVLIVNPERDTYVIIHHHGIRSTSWSLYSRGEDQRVRHAMGPVSTYSSGTPNLEERAAVLGAYHLAADQIRDDQLNADQQAALMFMGAAAVAAERATKQTVVNTSLGRALHDMLGQESEVGGASALILTPEDNESHGFAMEMLQVVSEKTGAYIATQGENNGLINGGNEVVVNGEKVVSWMDLAATDRGNRFHAAGSSNSHPLIAGPRAEIPLTRANLVYRGISHYLDQIKKTPDDKIIIVGGGEEGSALLQEAVKNKKKIGAVVDGDLNALFQARKGLQNQEEPVLYFFDQAEAIRRFGSEQADQWVAQAETAGFVIVENVADALRRYDGNTGVLSVWGNNHVTSEVLGVFKEKGGHAIFGVSRDMFDPLDPTLADTAQAMEIFIPSTVAFRVLGEIVPFYGALKVTQEKMGRALELVEKRVAYDYHNAYQVQVAPRNHQKKSAMDRWNFFLTSGIAVGGRFDMSDGLATPPGGSPGASGIGPRVTGRVRKMTGETPLVDLSPSSVVSNRSFKVRGKPLRVKSTGRQVGAANVMLLSNRGFNAWLRRRVRGDALMFLRDQEVIFGPEERRLIVTAHLSGSFVAFNQLVLTLAQESTPEKNPTSTPPTHFGAARGVPAAARLPVGVGR